MNRTHFFFLFFGLFAISACQPAENEQPPNILFLFTDDQTYTAIQALGNDAIQTPNMDRLVDEGTTFSHAYNMGAWGGAVCVASRAMIMSGRFIYRAQRIREQWADKDSLAIQQTWGRLMAANGYDTYVAGKWHIPAPPEQVFEEVRNIRPGMPRDTWGDSKVWQKINQYKGQEIDLDTIMPIGYNRPKSPDDDSWSPSDPQFGGYWQGGKHWSEVVKDDALMFIEQAAQKDNPFFMYIAFNAPHDPRQSPQEYIDQYPLDQIQLPPNWQPEYPGKDSIGLGPGLRDEALAPFPRTEYATKKHIQEYYAIVSHLDAQIGQILDALEASGKLENTYIFFTADHGLAIGNHGLLGKQNMYDHSMRVPLMAVGPRFKKGAKIDGDVYLQDIMPTTLELAGIEPPDYVEFKSLLPMAEGQRDRNYDAVFGTYTRQQRMIRKDGFKLIVYPPLDQVKLFDLQKDPYEMNNLAEQPDYQDKVSSLLADLKTMQEEMEDPILDQ